MAAVPLRRLTRDRETPPVAADGGSRTERDKQVSTPLTIPQLQVTAVVTSLELVRVYHQTGDRRRESEELEYAIESLRLASSDLLPVSGRSDVLTIEPPVAARTWRDHVEATARRIAPVAGCIAVGLAVAAVVMFR